MGMTATGAAPRRLIVMDVDSTFINEEVIDLLGEHAGVGAQMAAITAAAMRGELDFAASLERRVVLLRGLSVSVLADVARKVTYTPGALDLVAEAHARGWRVGLVSGGFHEVVDDLARRAGVDLWLANRLDAVDGRLTGKTVGTVVTREVKRRALETWAAELGIPLSHTIAMGDGANDIPMIEAAGIGIAFCAKPAVRAVAPHAIEVRDLMQVFPLVDAIDADTDAGMGA